MWDHATNGLVKDTTWRAEMEGTTTRGIEACDLSEICMVLHCIERVVRLASVLSRCPRGPDHVRELVDNGRAG